MLKEHENKSSNVVYSGQYRIVTTLPIDHKGFGVEIDFDSKICVLKNNDPSAQVWEFIYNESGNYYLIKNLEENRYLTYMGDSVGGIGGDSSVNSLQYWLIEKTEDNSILIKSYQHQDKVLDIVVDPAEGVKIKMANKSGSSTQKFKLESSSIYYIKSKLSPTMKLGTKLNHDNIKLCDNNGRDRWKFIYNKEKNAYLIKNVQNGNYITWLSSTGSSVVEFSKSGYNDQFWIIEKLDDGYIVIKSLHNTNMVLDVSGGEVIDSANIQVSDRTDSPTQKFKLRSFNYEGPYYIKSKLSPENPNNALHIEISTSNNQAELWEKHSSSQVWNFIYDPYKHAYLIKNMMTDNYLTWLSSSGNTVKGFEYSGYNDQYWIIEELYDGSVFIVNYHNQNKVLDISEGNANSGATIIVFDKNQNGTSQKFLLEVAFSIREIPQLVRFENGEYSRQNIESEGFQIYWNAIDGEYFDTVSGYIISADSNNFRVATLFFTIDGKTYLSKSSGESYIGNVSQGGIDYIINPDPFDPHIIYQS